MTTTRGSLAYTLLRLAPVLLLLLIPFGLSGLAQSSTSWADDILKQESYASPPRELAEAVLAPRHLNVTLLSVSPDKNGSWTRSVTVRS